MSDAFLSACRAAIGAAQVLTDAVMMAPYLLDWRRRRSGRALAVLRPGTSAEVAALVRLCNQFLIPVVPQGGNTGLVLGSTPDTSGHSVVLSLTRLNRIRAIDALNHTLIAEAGCILQTVQQAAHAAGRLFPLSLAAEGSCTIGGNLSTNAGGTAVLRYGNARALCLGLEVVTAQGELWDGLRGLRKDNTGYDLRDLFIGAEGTLGVITAAVLQLFALPRGAATALIAVADIDAALRVLELAHSHCGAALVGCELISDQCLQLVHRQFADTRAPFATSHAYYLLLQLADSESDQHAQQLLQSLLEQALKADLIIDAVVAASLDQARQLWRLRELIPAAQTQAGGNLKHDIALPLTRIADFISATGAALQQAWPGCQPMIFGHLGDGNLHYNVSAPTADVSLLKHEAPVSQIVYDAVSACDGSIAAEHGIGELKRESLLRHKSPLEIQLMRAIKIALDPLNLMNPGKVI